MKKQWLNEEKVYFDEKKVELESTIPEKYGVQTPEELEATIKEFKPEVDRLEQLVQMEQRQKSFNRSRDKRANGLGAGRRKGPVPQAVGMFNAHASPGKPKAQTARFPASGLPP